MKLNKKITQLTKTYQKLCGKPIFEFLTACSSVEFLESIAIYLQYLRDIQILNVVEPFEDKVVADIQDTLNDYVLIEDITQKIAALKRTPLMDQISKGALQKLEINKQQYIKAFMEKLTVHLEDWFINEDFI